MQRVDNQLLKDGVYPTVVEGSFELVLQGANAGLLQVGLLENAMKRRLFFCQPREADMHLRSDNGTFTWRKCC